MSAYCNNCYKKAVSAYGGRHPDIDDSDLPLCTKHTCMVGLILGAIVCLPPLAFIGILLCSTALSQ